ncbi:MAG: hypothetical protein AB7O68_19995 [Pirellulales bacterium]
MATLTHAPVSADAYAALLIVPGQPTELLELSEDRDALVAMQETFDQIGKGRRGARIDIVLASSVDPALLKCRMGG